MTTNNCKPRKKPTPARQAYYFRSDVLLPVGTYFVDILITTINNGEKFYQRTQTFQLNITQSVSQPVYQDQSGLSKRR